jgi:hypothetical protein
MVTNNNTYNAIINALRSSPRQWEKYKEDLTKVSIRKLPKRDKKSSSYMLFYDGVFTGTFIKEQFIDLNELNETFWKFDGEFNLFA